MTASDFHSLYIILVMAVITFFLRATPFILFPAHIETPAFIVKLSTLMPRAMVGFLVIYCFKNVSFTVSGDWVPELIAVIAIVAVHLFKRNTLISISVGTVIYIVLVNGVFI